MVGGWVVIMCCVSLLSRQNIGFAFTSPAPRTRQAPYGHAPGAGGCLLLPRLNSELHPSNSHLHHLGRWHAYEQAAKIKNERRMMHRAICTRKSGIVTWKVR